MTTQNTFNSAQAVKLLPRADDFIASVPWLNTATTYRYMLGTFALFLTKKSKVDDLSAWTDTIISDFHVWLVKRDYQMSTISGAISAVRRYLQYLDAYDLLPFSLDKAFSKWYNIRGGRRYNSQSRVREADPQVPRIVEYYDALPLPEKPLQRLEILRARAVVHTLYASAGRASEIASLTRAALRDGKLAECKIVGKGGKERMLFLTKEAQGAIAAYCKARDDNFPGMFISHGRGAGNPLSRRTIWAIVNHAAKELHIEGFSGPHAFRHYRAQSLLDAGMDIETLQALLGHANIDLTRRVYAPKTPTSKIRAQIEKFGMDAKTAAKLSV
jgi:site-specific recombinase XerD